MNMRQITTIAPQRLREVVLTLMAAMTVLPAACNGSADPVTPNANAKIPDSVLHFDPSKYKKPVFNGIDLYTGPYSTPKDMHGLTIVGYNYTDTYIDSFTVNGAGGGNLELSNGSAGGGKGTCCAPISPDTPLPMTVDIAWNRDSEMPWCKQTVLLDGPIPEKAFFFEVHFYPDGKIKVAITDSESDARVQMPRFNRIQRRVDTNKNNDSKFSICK